MPMRPKPKGKTVLFVDDEKYVHDYERNVAKKLHIKPRFAGFPEHAWNIIRKRIIAIEKLKKQKQSQLKFSTPKKKAVLVAELLFLSQLKKKPFDLVVSDINMPKHFPTGIAFIKELKKVFPRQKILIHSDDFAAMDGLKKSHGIPSAPKRFFREPALARGISKMLNEK